MGRKHSPEHLLGFLWLEQARGNSLGFAVGIMLVGCGIQQWVKQGTRLLCELSSHLKWENDSCCVGLVGHRERQGSISELEQGHWKRGRGTDAAFSG